jgi:hypothetical protein
MVIKSLEGKKKAYPVKVTFSKAQKFGIPVKTADLVGLPFVRRGTVVRLEKPEEKSYALSFHAWSRCPRIGYAPSLILIIFEPGKESDLQNWVKEHASLFDDPELSVPDDMKEFKNVTSIESIEGYEIAALTEIRKLSYVIAATLDPIPYGPEGVMIDFPRGTIPAVENDQAGFKARLIALWKTAFPNARQSDFDLAQDKGTRFSANVFGPAQRFISGPEYKDRWLKTNVVFHFFKSPSDGTTNGTTIDRLVLEIPDGFLPKWPPDATEPPTQDHYRQFHLNPEGASKTEDFSVLNNLQKKLSRAFVERWRGEVIE